MKQTPTRLRYGSRIAIRKHAFSQKTLDEIVDVFAAKRLPDFGYKYIQLDDAYQTGNGSCPQNWLTWNPKFPGGPEYALQKIKSAGMEGGIWVHRIHRPNDPHVADIGKQHPDWFVKKAEVVTRGEIVAVRIVPPATKAVAWSIKFAATP